MKVITIEAHGNVFGDQYEKAVDDSYECPDDHAAALIASGVVKADEAKPVQAKGDK